MQKGCFITFEGADGCGKTTQLKLAQEYLSQKGFEVLVTREPGGSKLGVQLRSLLLDNGTHVSETCESFLYLADRAQHVDTLIQPALKEGKIVLCDRYIDSTIAYQGYGRNIDLTRLKLLNDIATGELMPDLTLLFDLDSHLAQKRLTSTKDRIESEGFEFHKKVRFGYLEAAKLDPGRIKIVNAQDPIEKVFESVKTLIDNALNNLK